MILALSGTPGTGKTTIAEILEQRYKHTIINIHAYAKQEHLIETYDETRNSDIIDMEQLNQHINAKYSSNQLTILDSHIAHELSCVSEVIVLRCHPYELKIRLQQRKWKTSKINENIEAEILDIILCEAVSMHTEDHVYEIDTTTITPDEIAQEIHQLITNKFSNAEKYKPGLIDWSEHLFSDEYTIGGTQDGS